MLVLVGCRVARDINRVTMYHHPGKIQALIPDGIFVENKIGSLRAEHRDDLSGVPSYRTPLWE